MLVYDQSRYPVKTWVPPLIAGSDLTNCGPAVVLVGRAEGRPRRWRGPVKETLD